MLSLAVGAALSFHAPALTRFATPRVGGLLMQEADAEVAEAATEAVEEVAPPAPAPKPVASKDSSQALPFMERPANLDGSMVGDVGFDPFGFSNHELGPFDTPAEHMAWMREAELKHGRICMLATVGWISVDLGLADVLPGEPAVFKGINSYAAHDIAVQQGGLFVLLLTCMVFEIAGAGGIAASLQGTRTPGDFALTGGFGKTAETMEQLKQSEIKHARLGMMAFGGIATQCAVFGPETAFPYLG